MSSRIEDLDPDVQQLALALLQRLARKGILLRVTQTRRTWEEQAKLYAQGRTTPGNRVTNAKAGSSWHQMGRAFDVADMDSTPYDFGKLGAADDDDFWETIGNEGEALGLIWGGRFKSIMDRPHFEHHGGRTLAEARTKHLEQHPEDGRFLA
jgi:peptidoglycan L-alanyl-D-glutamate endopeptidase CwlK